MVRTLDMSDLLDAVREWVQDRVRVENVDEAEAVAQEVARAIGEVVVEEAIHQTDGRQSYEGCSLECPCGRRARFVGFRKRNVSTVCGVVRVTRAYYHCGHCGQGQIPWDVEQGMNQRLWTSGVKALVAEMSARLPYRETTTVLERLLGLRLEESSAEAIIGEVGDGARGAEREAMRAVEAGEAMLCQDPAPKRLYVAMDGSHIHVDGAWHEVKTGIVYAGVCGRDGIDTSGSKRYVSAQETAESFGGRLYVAASQSGVLEAGEVVVVGDGAEWIWNLADHHYPDATKIVDYWHACQHIHDVGKSHYGEGSPAGERWARDHCRRLKAHGPKPLLRALRRWKARSPEDAESIKGARRYFTKNAKRMDYPAFRQRGLMIGSGPVEAACKVVVGFRLKQAGMRWKSPGADAILALRCLVLNGQYDKVRGFARAA
jgi:hypothetical protein